jgi:hypothetical protein
MNYAMQYNNLLDNGYTGDQAEARLESMKREERRQMVDKADEKDSSWYAAWCERCGTWKELYDFVGRLQ